MPKYYSKSGVAVPVDQADGKVIVVAPRTEFYATEAAARHALGDLAVYRGPDPEVEAPKAKVEEKPVEPQKVLPKLGVHVTAPTLPAPPMDEPVPMPTEEEEGPKVTLEEEGQRTV